MIGFCPYLAHSYDLPLAHSYDLPPSRKCLTSNLNFCALSYDLLGSKKSTPGRTGAPARKLASGRSGVEFLPRTAQPAVPATLRAARPSLAGWHLARNATPVDGVGQAGRGRSGLSRPTRAASTVARAERSEGGEHPTSDRTHHSTSTPRSPAMAWHPASISERKTELPMLPLQSLNLETIASLAPAAPVTGATRRTPCGPCRRSSPGGAD